METVILHKIKRVIFSCSLLLCIFTGSLVSQEVQLIQDVNKLDSLEGEDFRDAVFSIFESFDTITDTKLKTLITDSLFDKTEQKDEISHIQSLIFKAKYSDNPNPKLYDEAFNLANKYNRVTDMCFVEYSRSQYYIACEQYDSAMFYLLSYRDMTFPDKNDEGYRNILNILGDIYFHAGLYDQANEVYFDMYNQYEKAENWNFYRPYVLMNNMGQIALKTGDYQKSAYWFNHSLELAEQYLFTPYRENTIAYTKIKLAETALKINDIETSELLLGEVDDIQNKNVYEDVIQEFMFTKAQLLLKKGKVDEAMVLAKQLIPEDSNQFNQYRFVPEVYHFLSDAYFKMGKYEYSSLLMKEYQRITDSLHIGNNLAQSMILLADHNYKQIQLGLIESRQRVNILVLSILFLLLILFVVLYLYRKLFRSKLELVRKSLEKNVPIAYSKDEVENKSAVGGLSAEDVELERKLIIRLQEYMNKSKPYLDQKISIDELAKQLSTNRTYLSRAINNQLKISFPNFINKYRIRESIILIIEGYAVNHTQEALAKESGFSSRTVFISAFKKNTGVVPSFFINNYKKN